MRRSLPLPLWSICIVTMMCSGTIYALAEDGALGPPAPSLNPLASLNPASMTSFRERPLFSASRRAANAPVVTETTTAAVSASLKIRLIGVLQTPQGAVASVVDVDSGSKRALRLGDTMGNWSVISIDHSSLTLRRGEETAMFSVFKATPPLLSSAGQGHEAERAEVLPPASAVRIIDMSNKAGVLQDTKSQAPKSREAQDVIDVFGTGARSAKP